MPNTRSANWRSYVNVHPAADLFPLLPPEELAEMTERIKANGIQVPLAFYTDEQGKIWLLDGRNRLDALAASGYDVEAFLKSKPSRLHYRAPNDDPEEVVVRLNIFRRHLTQEQKRDLVAKLLKATPERSNTDTARLALVDPKTVSSVRRREEAKGKIPRMDKTVGRDGRARTTTPAPRAPRSAPKIEEEMPKPSPSPERDQNVVAVAGMLGKDLAKGLQDLVKVVGDYSWRMVGIADAKRQELVQGWAKALSSPDPYISNQHELELAAAREEIVRLEARIAELEAKLAQAPVTKPEIDAAEIRATRSKGGKAASYKALAAKHGLTYQEVKRICTD